MSSGARCELPRQWTPLVRCPSQARAPPCIYRCLSQGRVYGPHPTAAIVRTHHASLPATVPAAAAVQVLPSLIPHIAAAMSGVGVIDIFSALGGAGLSQPHVTCDGVHPVSGTHPMGRML